MREYPCKGCVHCADVNCPNYPGKRKGEHRKMTLTERINAAAEDMSFDSSVESTPGDHLMQFLSNHGLEIVDAKSERAAGPGSHAADLKALRVEQDQNTLLVAMLRNMVAAPVFWRSRAKALLSRIDGVESPNPATPPASES